MSEDMHAARRAVESWRLGQTSAHYESSGLGAGVISSGKGDHGGVSYGAYQLSSKMGTLAEYLEQSRYGEQFKGLTPATPTFNAKWKEIARTDPEFARDQHDYIGRSHYGEQLDKLKGAGLDLSTRGRAVQDVIWSTSVQFGGLTQRIVGKGIEEKFGKGVDLSLLSDKDVVVAIQDYKISHNSTLFKSSPEWQPGLLRRAQAEKASLVALAGHEESLRRSGVDLGVAPVHGKAHRSREDVLLDRSTMASDILKSGDENEHVRLVQKDLLKLGYTDRQGRSLKLDGDFGQRTEEALRAFQKAHGLRVDGVVGKDTRLALQEATLSPLLSEKTHPDHGLFREVKDGIARLGPGAVPGGSEDGLAAAVAAQAKLGGLRHVDHVLMNSQGDRVLAVQGDLHDPAKRWVHVDRVEALGRSVESSTGELKEGQLQREQAAQANIQAQHMEHRSGLSVGMRP
ncbi:peptidoglycan-binding domain-containing protein [Lysobacter solisilvae (ex Woo and Kim 2020)]|uniref:Peptidoglycan-binding protein n=1 Tax=Agrilutibacter terrestris TaxID=2865112 RepID=A0A7H0FVJ9_9GAMM|nr:peptidoglycan-binding domain-containing protein [Lysobacter terrestris]QNP40065.1 peptidoglycan-binding protein [Lysobacter terrestris]